MALQFQKHYSRDEARALLPRIRQWLQQLHKLRQQFNQLDGRVAQRLTSNEDIGGELVNNRIKCLVELARVRREFDRREIQIKDLDRGLIDFPAIIGGREVFLCWEQDEEDIEYWHDLDTGYAGREKL
jgi:hypothetical protein